MPDQPKRPINSNIVLMWILEHGGEWPDWGDHFKVALISQVAATLDHAGLREQIHVAVKLHAGDVLTGAVRGK